MHDRQLPLRRHAAENCRIDLLDGGHVINLAVGVWGDKLP